MKNRKALNHVILSGVIALAILNSCTNLKKEKFEVGQILCSEGEMLFWLHNETPEHKASFIKLANENYWDSLTFNRVIENFVIQGGCLDTPEGFSDSPYLIQPEFSDSLTHIYGAVGAGRDNNPDKLSAGCQFYIVHSKDGLHRLDNNYVIFGQVFKGLDVLERIGQVKTDSHDAPVKPLILDINIIELTRKEINEYGVDL